MDNPTDITETSCVPNTRHTQGNCLCQGLYEQRGLSLLSALAQVPLCTYS